MGIVDLDIRLKLDVNELKEQKKALLALREYSDSFSNELDGLVHLVDYIQDSLVENAGLDENDVFDFEND
jgi:hypothetical protein